MSVYSKFITVYVYQ